jgi:hypothetical protein
VKDYSKMPYHPTMEKIVEILMKKTQNNDPVFFRLMVCYFFCKMASMMRASVELAATQVIPINMYAINLAPSGSGKGHSVGTIEENVINRFREKFLEETFPETAERNLHKLALKRAKKNQSDEDDEIARAQMEFEEMGTLLFSFDSATPAALKQMRTKLLLAGAGSMNFEMDEMGSNLLGNGDALTTFLELFDMGRIKQKLVKNTRENVRSEDLFGPTPTNMLLFGTPTKLLNGSKTEDEYYEFLEIGYARRCFFGFCRVRKTKAGQTAQDIYNIYNDPRSIQYLATLSDQFGLLADKTQFNQCIRMKKDVSLALFDYRIYCQTVADEMSEYDEILKAEISHRYFKVAKLAAAYAFIDKAAYVKMEHLENAIAMAELSGEAFNRMMKRDRPHIKLANYIALVGRELTHADLVEDLPFYKGSEQAKREMLNLAMGYGYKNNIFIRKDIIDGIEFLSGKSVPVTDLEKMIFAASDNITTGYTAQRKPFSRLHRLVTAKDYHWVNHALKDAYRDEAHVIEGFNMICLDVEHSASIDMAKFLLKDYKYLMHTTKRHTAKEHRYRIIMPLSHTLELDSKDFREFMNNIYEWLPFDVDKQTAQRSRKWLTNQGDCWYNDGQLLDALQFVPKTKKAEEHKAILSSQTNFSALERWFVNNTLDGNRSNMLMKYAYALIDKGQDMPSIQNNVLALNKKLQNPLEETEVLSTILVTANKKFHTK